MDAHERFGQTRGWVAAGLASLFFLGPLSGCAALRAAAERRDKIEERVQKHVYTQPQGTVWAEARALLFEMGYEVSSAANAFGATVETEWKYDGNWQTRYLVQAMSVEGGTKVQFMKSTQTVTSATSPRARRDLDAEWALLQKIDPSAASEIEAYAQGPRVETNR
ncbi:MAG: hypothetical protein IPK13_12260 [Deltaproteobacteria bacterium]|nr:hypothetical protein [Deltaproteobacteria bacterium]